MDAAYLMTEQQSAVVVRDTSVEGPGALEIVIVDGGGPDVVWERDREFACKV